MATMSYKEEQEQELEALEAIYPTELQMISSEYPSVSFNVTLYSSHEQENTTQCDGDVAANFPVCLTLSFPDNYPEIAPKIEVSGLEEQFSEERIHRLLNVLKSTARDNLTMPMAFTIISVLQDEIAHLVDEVKTEKDRAAELLKQKVEEEEQKKFEGTRVTVESFIKWRQKFNEERRIARAKEFAAEQAALAGKLTGKQQFLRDATLSLSDIALIQEGDQKGVEIDESLFEDIDDLELEESDEN